MAGKIKVGKGTRFRSPIADGNPMFVVTRARGRGVWEAVVVANEPDFAGTVKVFTDREIAATLAMEAFWEQNADDGASFYAGLAVGAVVHYHDGFNQWVRCEVVVGPTVHDAKPHKCLKPIALVGAWRPYTLPRRCADGTVDLGYHAKTIAEGRLFEPNYTNIYESGEVRDVGLKDPRGLPAIDLTPPPVGDFVKAALWKAVQGAQAALGGPTTDDPRAKLEAALGIIQATLAAAGGSP